MAVKITYLVHSTTVDNEKKIASGWNDVELSRKGQEQALTLKSLLVDKEFDVIFCSDLKRAKVTAEIVFGEKYQIIFDPRLRECNYGDHNGKEVSLVEVLLEENPSIPLPNGESYEQVKGRVSSFLEDLKKLYDGKSIVIVSHKAPQLAIEVILNGYSWEDAIAKDWRKVKAWQPGWEYELH